MSHGKHIAIAGALCTALGVAPLAAATTLAGAPALSESQMQGLASEGPAWHSGDGSLYDESRPATKLAAPGSAIAMRPAEPAPYGSAPYVELTPYGATVPRSHTQLMLPDDATNDLTPAQASRVTGHEDSAAGPPRTGSEEQPGNMGPNSSKGK